MKLSAENKRKLAEARKQLIQQQQIERCYAERNKPERKAKS